MTEPNPDPRAADRPEPAGGKAHWDALTTPAEATGGFTWREIRDGATPQTLREAELLPVDVNTAEEPVPEV